MDKGDRGGQEEKRERNEEKVEKEAAGRKGVRDNAGVEVTTVIVTKKSLQQRRMTRARILEGCRCQG